VVGFGGFDFGVDAVEEEAGESAGVGGGAAGGEEFEGVELGEAFAEQRFQAEAGLGCLVR